MESAATSIQPATDEQIDAWQTELDQRLKDYDAIAAPLRAKIKALEAQLATKTARLIPQIRGLKALLKHSEPYHYIAEAQRRGQQAQAIVITREKHAELTARWGPYASAWLGGVSFNEYIASLDWGRAFSWLGELQHWYRYPDWWATLFGDVPEDEGREALHWLIHQVKYQLDALDDSPPVRFY